jgi:hypothetical protein
MATIGMQRLMPILIQLMFSSLLLAASPQVVRVGVLPLTVESKDSTPARQMTALLQEVLGGMHGVELKDWSKLPPKQSKQLEQLLKRCGDQFDCQLRIGRALKLQLMFVGSVTSLGEGAVLHLQVIELSTKKVINKLSRSLTGSRAHRAEAIEILLTRIIFPERMVGRIEMRLEPPGGFVYLDSQIRVKDAPALVNLVNISEGPHTITVSLDGYKDFFVMVQVPFKGVSQLDIKLRKAN